MSDDIVKRLRELAQAKHDDLSVGDEAADEITRLRAALATAKREGMEAIERHFRIAAAGTPLGYEDHQRGASVYNWLMYCATTIAAIRAAAEEGSDE